MLLLNSKIEIEDLENKKIKEIIIATSNPHKLEEINAINQYKNIKFSIISGDFNPIENGKTFEENSIIKAREAAKLTSQISLADDSGLCVDLLNGAPGLYSARYADTPENRIKKLINELSKFPEKERTAHFISVISLVDANGNLLHKTEGKIEGLIINSVKGKNGFGYDPVFFLPEYNKTMAELDSKTKNMISHRAKALSEMLGWIDSSI